MDKIPVEGVAVGRNCSTQPPSAQSQALTVSASVFAPSRLENMSGQSWTPMLLRDPSCENDFHPQTYERSKFLHDFSFNWEAWSSAPQLWAEGAVTSPHLSERCDVILCSHAYCPDAQVPRCPDVRRNYGISIWLASTGFSV